MVDIPEEFQDEEGVSSRKLTRKVVVGIVMQGVTELSTDSKKWEKGLEKALSFGRKNGMKFNFSRMTPTHFQSNGNSLGILYLLEDDGMKYKTRFKDEKTAREYIEDYVKSEDEIIDCRQMAREFLQGFGYTKKRKKSNLGEIVS